MNAQDERPHLIVTVAPNGARRSKRDHPALPMRPDELAATAKACLEQGAAMIHLHVRDADGGHTLDVGAYRAALEAVDAAVGRELLVQVTSEAVGIYRPEQQMAMVRELRPEAVSLGVREIIPDDGHESAAAEFLLWLRQARILPQFILYSADELWWFNELIERGVIPFETPPVLFVLGRYTKDQTSSPSDLLPYLNANLRRLPYSVCAFGRREAACALAAATLDGHCRVGFENNLHLPDGRLAPDNAALVRTVVQAASATGRPLADAEEARRSFAQALGY